MKAFTLFGDKIIKPLIDFSKKITKGIPSISKILSGMAAISILFFKDIKKIFINFKDKIIKYKNKITDWLKKHNPFKFETVPDLDEKNKTPSSKKSVFENFWEKMKNTGKYFKNQLKKGVNWIKQQAQLIKNKLSIEYTKSLKKFKNFSLKFKLFNTFNFFIIFPFFSNVSIFFFLSIFKILTEFSYCFLKSFWMCNHYII